MLSVSVVHECSSASAVEQSHLYGAFDDAVGDSSDKRAKSELIHSIVSIGVVLQSAIVLAQFSQ